MEPRQMTRLPDIGNKLPFGSEFSPSQVDLPRLLKIIEEYAGDFSAIEGAILKAYFSKHGGEDNKKAERNRRTLAMNCRLGLQSYGIVDGTGNLTTLGE